MNYVLDVHASVTNHQRFMQIRTGLSINQRPFVVIVLLDRAVFREVAHASTCDGGTWGRLERSEPLTRTRGSTGRESVVWQDSF